MWTSQGFAISSEAMRYCLAVLGICASPACKSAEPSAPRPEGMEPLSTVEGVSVATTIYGRSFWIKTNANFVTGDHTVDASFTARLGDTLLEPVEYVTGKQLAAVVPSTLAVGVYDLTVVDPVGRVGVLREAFTVLADSTLQDGASSGDSDTPTGDPPTGDGDPYAGDGTSVCVDSCVCDNDSTCSLACPGGGCDLVCDSETICDGACSQDCVAECQGNALCDLSCGTGCTYTCLGSTVCSFHCQSDCSVDCIGSAQCRLSCADPTGCSVNCIGGAAVDCGGGVFTCRTACP